MAMVHPSRMGLVPQDTRPAPSQRRSQSPRRRSRSRSPARERERTQDRNRDRDRDYSGRDKHNGNGSTRSRSRGRDERGRGDRGYDRPRSKDRDGPRRASPAYDDYRRPEVPADQAQAPWRREENMSSDRRGGASGYRLPGGGGADYMESRRLERESKEANIWPPSPKAPMRDLSPKRKKSSKRHRRARSSSSESSEDEEERRRRERKERKRARKDKDRSEPKRRRRSHSRSRRRHRDSEDESEDDRDRRRHRRSKTKSRSPSKRLSKTRSPSPSKSPEPSADEWVPKAASSSMPPPPPPPQVQDATTSLPPSHDDDADMNDSDDEGDGPVPLNAPSVSRRLDERAYGGALLRGEGSAMAAFLLEDPSVRIPRRGEIGLTSDEIAQYESVGYVMSGSRHRRMNAVRMRKENQVISAEEKRGILKLQKEERSRREAILREEFTSLIDENLKATDGKPKPSSQQ